jgi:transcription antitermination protein NusB
MADPARTDEPPSSGSPVDAEVVGGDQLSLDIAIEALEAAEADDPAGAPAGADQAAEDERVGAVGGAGGAAGGEAGGAVGGAGGAAEGAAAGVVGGAGGAAGGEAVGAVGGAGGAAGGEAAGDVAPGDAVPEDPTADAGQTSGDHRAKGAESAARSRGRRGRSRGGRDATPRRTDTRDPRRARERALKILFQADIRGVNPVVTLQRLADDPAARAMLDDADDLTEEQELLAQAASDAAADTTEGPAVPATRIDDFTRSLVLGVADNQAEIDALIGRFARRWQVSRMPVVDRTVLRLATYELMHESTSPAVVINEAVDLAKALSTDDSGRYVNGVLESVRKHLAKQAKPGSDAASD